MSYQRTPASSQRTRLAELRIAAGLTQRQLAARAGVSRDTLVRAEHNVGTIRLTSARALAHALDVSLGEVFR